MAASKKSKFENKFKSTAASDSRTANVRDERKVKDKRKQTDMNSCSHRSVFVTTTYFFFVFLSLLVYKEILLGSFSNPRHQIE